MSSGTLNLPTHLDASTPMDNRTAMQFRIRAANLLRLVFTPRLYAEKVETYIERMIERPKVRFLSNLKIKIFLIYLMR